MERIGPDLFRLATGGFAAPHLIVGNVATLVDAGGPGRGPAVARELQDAGFRIERIILTHGDPDHAGGSDHLRQMTGAEVCASLIERPLLDRSGWPSLPRVRRLLMQAFFRGVRPPTVDRWTDGAEDVGGIQVVPTPGHTPGHIALLWEGWLLAGDAFRTGQRFRESIWPFTIDQAASRQTIEGLLALAPQAASSSHGRPAHAATERLQTLVATWR